jgi:ATP-dependent Clp protease adaptor protein ClpS
VLFELFQVQSRWLISENQLNLVIISAEKNMKVVPEVNVGIEEEEVVKDIKLYSIVVFNDDVNTFDYVIDTLIEYCGHTYEQAEQCTLLIHFKGKCAVKNGDFEELAPLRTAITDRGISAEIILR